MFELINEASVIVGGTSEKAPMFSKCGSCGLHYECRLDCLSNVSIARKNKKKEELWAGLVDLLSLL